MQKRKRKLVTASVAAGGVIAISLGVGLLLVSGDRDQEHGGADREPTERTISPAATYKNLSVFLVRGPDRIKGRSYLTLEEALDRKAVEVKETGAVSQLSIDSSAKTAVFIQSGEIVRGGRQDRALRYDLIVSAGSKGEPLASFCVEQGRWSSRGAEPVSKFSSAKNALSSKQLRVANLIGSQIGVWSEVGNAQMQISNSLGVAVNAGASPTSLELSLDNESLKRRTRKYISAVKAVLGDLKHTVGFGFAINGEISGVHLYGTSGLAIKLLPKLLRAAAVEAISVLKRGGRYRPINDEKVRVFMSEALDGKRTTRRLSDRVRMHISETEKSVAYHTYDLAAKEILHESYLSR